MEVTQSVDISELRTSFEYGNQTETSGVRVLIQSLIRFWAQDVITKLLENRPINYTVS
jgi:hypothetical protein